MYFVFLSINSEIKRDKTMEDKLMYIPNDNTQITPLNGVRRAGKSLKPSQDLDLKNKMDLNHHGTFVIIS